MSLPQTGDYGGQCVDFVNNQLGTSVRGHGGQWYTSSQTTPCTIRSRCVACWSGGPSGFGHVGLVYTWDEASRTMNYMDSNYDNDELVHYRKGITEQQMKNLFGSSFKFQGYVTVP